MSGKGTKSEKESKAETIKETGTKTGKEAAKETAKDLHGEAQQNSRDTGKKVVTRYDLKVQRREEAKARAKRDRRFENVM